jgi:hypothetical protein
MVTKKTFSGKPFKQFVNGVDLYRVEFGHEDRQQLHREIRQALGPALYRMEDLGVGYVSVYVHRRLMESGARILNFGEHSLAS